MRLLRDAYVSSARADRHDAFDVEAMLSVASATARPTPAAAAAAAVGKKRRRGPPRADAGGSLFIPPFSSSATTTSSSHRRSSANAAATRKSSQSNNRILSIALVAIGFFAVLSATGHQRLSLDWNDVQPSTFGTVATVRRRLAEAAGIVEHQRQHACAAFSVCGDPCDATRSQTCTEAIDQCSSTIDRIDGPLGSTLAVLSSNPTYRLKDILFVIGNRYRLDSMTILGEPRYRGTLLRETLVRTSTYDKWGNGTMVSLHSSLSPDEVEAMVQTRSDVEGQPPGTAYMDGREGGNGIYLADRDDTIPTFAGLLKQMYEEGRCEGVVGPDYGGGAEQQVREDQPLIVSYRMGDETWPKSVADDYAAKLVAELSSVSSASPTDEEGGQQGDGEAETEAKAEAETVQENTNDDEEEAREAANEDEGEGNTGIEIQEQRRRLLSVSNSRRRRLQIRGALHYGNDCHSGHYFRTLDSEVVNARTLSYFVEQLERGGVEVE